MRDPLRKELLNKKEPGLDEYESSQSFQMKKEAKMKSVARRKQNVTV